jgi:hypothetical protein
MAANVAKLIIHAGLLFETLAKRFTARCGVRLMAGNAGFWAGKIEAQPRRRTFCRGLEQIF